MLKINFEKECYGCGLCTEVCPVKCIDLKENEKGFFRAYVDETKCIECGACERLCIAAYKNHYSEIHSIKALYGYNLDEKKRNDGASGGVFIELATACLKKGYSIAGCIWDEQWKPVHILTDNMETVEKMQRSKYAQSDISSVLKPIKKALSQGEKVLFSGTPCQIAAVKKFVGDTEDLLCVGVICHGVASRKIWRKYLDTLCLQHGEIKTLRMREQLEEWGKLSLFVEFCDGKTMILSKPEHGQFMQCFQESLYLSERCFSCQYKGDSIDSDIILGDGWGQNPIVESMEDGKALSCVLLKSEKGKKLWDEIQTNFCVKEATAEMVARGNPRLVSPSKKNPRSKKFYREVEVKGMVDEDVLKKYMYANTPIAKLKKIVRSFLRFLHLS